MNNDILEHHGILGQKWGIRRFQARNGSLTAAGKKHLSENKSSTKGKISKRASKKPNPKPVNNHPKRHEDISKLSDEELNKRVQRLQTEVKYYENLSKVNSYKAPKSRGKKMVADVLEKSARHTGEQVAKYVMAEAVNKTMFNGKKVVNYKDKKKGQGDRDDDDKDKD